ncbi:unnamed protein product [Mytilus coruscus]|uniref:Galectin n=1 Tax=Mytilus coruscus TaxID=42192 RepID=A0A6J8CY39_MYTCO|nr:unnamed protein product [Mytilus coruscus]
MAKFLSANPTDDPVETPEDPNDPIPRETKWTNQVTINHAVLNVTAIFRVNNSAHPPSVTGRELFVTGFKYGINNGVLKLTLKKEVHMDRNITIPPIARGCRVNKELPTPDEYLCRESNVQFNEWNEHLPFQHGDIVTFTLQIKNGGYLFYIDRDAYPDNPDSAPRIREDFYGRTVSRDFVVQWDLVPPYHQCVENDGLKCATSPVFTQEVTNKGRCVAAAVIIQSHICNLYFSSALTQLIYIGFSSRTSAWFELWIFAVEQKPRKSGTVKKGRNEK